MIGEQQTVPRLMPNQPHGRAYELPSDGGKASANSETPLTLLWCLRVSVAFEWPSVIGLLGTKNGDRRRGDGRAVDTRCRRRATVTVVPGAAVGPNLACRAEALASDRLATWPIGNK